MFNSVRALYQVMHDARLSGPELDRLVDRRLLDVLVSAYCHVPYYRELMQNAGYDPRRAYTGPADLRRLPVTTKRDLKARDIEALVREGSDLSHCFTDCSSGSTGMPLRVYRDRDARAIQISRWLRVLFLNGYSIRDRVMALVSPSRLTEGQSFVQRFGVLRRLPVSRRRPASELVDMFLEYKPDVLYGNRSHLDLMALELRRRGIQASGLKLLVVTGEVITDATRRLYRQQFGLEPIESYGTTELGVLAYETAAHDGLHLCEDLTFFEFLDNEGQPVPPGEPARVVVTDLTNKLMPFIRYDQGDIAVVGRRDGTSGSDARRLTQIKGRASDYVILPDGTRWAYDAFAAILHDYEGIDQYRVVQRTPSQFHILIAAQPAYVEGIRDDVLRRLQERFKPYLAVVHFEIEWVAQLEPDPAGKLRSVVSEVDQAWE